MQDQHLPVSAPKSQLTGLVLTFFFGPLGLLYATPAGAIVMIVLTILLSMVTLGLAAILAWPASILCSFLAIAAHNSAS